MTQLEKVKSECKGSKQMGILEIYVGRILLCAMLLVALKTQIYAPYENYCTELLRCLLLVNF